MIGVKAVVIERSDGGGSPVDGIGVDDLDGELVIRLLSEEGFESGSDSVGVIVDGDDDLPGRSVLSDYRTNHCRQVE